MEIKQEKIDDLNAILNVTVTPEDYLDRVLGTLKDYARKANIKGFRPGKVPVSLMKKMYGKGVVFEEVNKIISEQLMNFIREQELDILGDPLPQMIQDIDLDPDSKATYEFKYEVGIAPAFELDYKKAKAPEQYEVNVDDEYLEKEINTIQETYGEMTNPEVSAEGDILYGKLIAADGQEKLIREGWDIGPKPEKMIALNPGRIASDKLKKKMAGKKAEDKIEGVKLAEIFEKEDLIKRFWEYSTKGERIARLTDEDFTNLGKMKFDFEVMKINHIEKAEIGQELFDKAFAGQEIDSEEKFKERVREDLTKFFENDSKKYLFSKTVESLLDAIPMDLPDAFLKKWLVQQDEKNTEELVEEEYGDYAKSLKWSLIARKIRKENEEAMKLTDEKLKERAMDNIRRQMASMMPNAGEEELEKMAGYYLANEKTREQIASELMEEMTFEVIHENLKPKGKKINASDYVKL